MNPKRLNSRYVLKMSLFIIGILLFLVLLVRLSVFFVPFIIALVVSILIEPLVRLLVNKCKIPRKAASAISLIVVVSTVGFLLTKLISKLFSEIVALSHVLPKYITEVYNNLGVLINQVTDIYVGLPHEITGNVQGVFSNLTKTLSELLDKVVKGAVITATSIPEVLVFIVITILSTYFLSSDREKIYNYFRSHLPDSWIVRFQSIKNDLFSALFAYIKAQLIMMTITFTELFAGFSIIGVKYSLVLAFSISIIDALPILGTGGVLVPWSIYSFLTGDIRTGVSLLILYAIVLSVRQMVEPKIISHQIGLHPLVTLTAMYTGLQMFGVPGMILGPVSILILKNVLTGVVKSGTIKEFLNQIRPPAEE